MQQNPWALLPKFGNNYILEIDQNIVSKHNYKSNDDYRLHTELIPEPFIGNINAPIVALNANPGYDENDNIIHNHHITRKMMLDNLSHSYSGFYYLSKEFDSSIGAKWWRKKLRQLIEHSSKESVSQNLLVIETMGYHSKKFNFVNLPSQLYSCQIVKMAIERGAIIIIMRSKNVWFELVPGLMNYKNLVYMNSWQATYFSPRNIPRFDEIVKAISQ